MKNTICEAVIVDKHNFAKRRGADRGGKQGGLAVSKQTARHGGTILANCRRLWGKSQKKIPQKNHTDTYKIKLGVVVGKNRNGVFNEAAVLGVGVGVG